MSDCHPYPRCNCLTLPCYACAMLSCCEQPPAHAAPSHRPAPDEPLVYHRHPCRAAKVISRIHRTQFDSESTHICRGVGLSDASAIEKESHALKPLARTLTKGIHKLFELRRLLDLEKDLVVVVSHLDVEMLRLLRLRRWSSAMVRHVVLWGVDAEEDRLETCWVKPSDRRPSIKLNRREGRRKRHLGVRAEDL